MTSRRRRGLLALAVAGLVVSAGSAALRSGGEAAQPPAAQLDRALGATHPAAIVEASLVLRREERALRSYLAAVADPASPRFRRYLGAAALGERFGPSAAQLQGVRRAVEAAGLRVSAEYPQRTALGIRGTAADVGRFLHTSFVERVDPAGHRYRVPAHPARVPAALARTVLAVSGLSTKPLPVPADVPGGGLGPKDSRAAYNVKPLHDLGIDGKGQTIAILSFDTFEQSDVAAFDKAFGIPADSPAVEKVRVKGGVPVPGSGETEVDLDIDVIRGIAPRAQILNYEAPNAISNFADLFDKIVADGRTDIVSVSWGICDSGFDAHPDRLRIERSIEAAVARGISIFVASGDAGAYDCQRFMPEDHRLTVNFPSSTPNVIAVGGTLLSVRSNGSYLEEAGWEDVLGNGGGGGGLSPANPRPAWQKDVPGIANKFSNGRRQVPDVAASADPDSGWFIVVDGKQSSSGGTSAAAPFWAASMLLIGQYAEREGAGKLGFVGPALYELARTERPFPPFHDVTRGGNRYYNAGPGWDYSTGLGTPDVWNLARDFVAYLKQRR
ncbi:MAG: S8/S53 family peptidase [Actinobacteria bacterium]|nr:S8/S53 family peptidase [Actinomycetota bacterium]